MKVLLFTHKNDIDGISTISLARKAFKEVDYEVCETFGVTDKVKEYIDNNKLNDYDYIYVTDLCIQEPILSIINESNIKNKLKVLDHHKSEMLNNKYDFVNINVEDETKAFSGTSLFYDELLSKGYLKDDDVTNEFVELVRQYDTWEWEKKYHNEKARDLSILLDMLGIEGYITSTYNKITNDKKFDFTELELSVINAKKNIIKRKVEFYVNNVFTKEVCGLKAAVVFIDYEYRNEVGKYLKDHNYDADFVFMVMVDKLNVSLRELNGELDLSTIASKFGGKGHKNAAAFSLDKDLKEKIFEWIIKDVN